MTSWFGNWQNSEHNIGGQQMIRATSMLVTKSVNAGILAGFFFLVLTSCGKTEAVKERAQPLGPLVGPLEPIENVAASSNGARAIATSSAAPQFAIANLNDGTPQPWGSADGKDDVYAAIVLPSAKAIREMRISLFSPEQPVRAHLRDIRVVAADSESKTGPKWLVVRSRLAKDQPFSEKVTVPPSADGTYVAIEIDPSDPNAGQHKIWGVACFSSSKGDARNYLAPGTGNGVYMKELQMK
jgi:hypothetical protein